MFVHVLEGKSLKDEDVLQHLPVGTTATFYFRDLGAQISWVTVSTTRGRLKTGAHCAVTFRANSQRLWLIRSSFQVFLTEYTGPLVIYLMFYFRVPFIYAPKYDFTTSKHWVVQWVSPTHLHKYFCRAFLSPSIMILLFKPSGDPTDWSSFCPLSLRLARLRLPGLKWLFHSWYIPFIKGRH